MPTTSSDLRKLSVVLFEGFELLDVFGPVQLFGSLPDVAIEYVGHHTGPVISSKGARVVADLAYEDLARPDILMVPGGQGTRTLVDDAGFLAWLGQAGSRADLVASVCTGSALLAAAGLLEGIRPPPTSAPSPGHPASVTTSTGGLAPAGCTTGTGGPRPASPPGWTWPPG